MHNHIRLLLQENKRERFSGSIIQLGKQDIYCTMGDLERWAAEDGSPLTHVGTPRLSEKPWYRERGFIDDETFFRALGFSQIESCDYSAYEGVAFTLDLNDATDPPRQYDVVYDGGTLEHVFNVANSLSNAHRMLQVGGRVVHFSSFNWVDHGYYMFSPILFDEYYRKNAYQMEGQFVVLWERSLDPLKRYVVQDVRAFRYQPGHSMDWLPTRRFALRGETTIGHFVVAKKTENSTCGRPPMQGAFEDLWQEKEGPQTRRKRSTIDRVKDAVYHSSGAVRSLRRHLKLQRSAPQPTHRFRY